MNYDDIFLVCEVLTQSTASSAGAHSSFLAFFSDAEHGPCHGWDCGDFYFETWDQKVKVRSWIIIWCTIKGIKFGGIGKKELQKNVYNICSQIDIKMPNKCNPCTVGYLRASAMVSGNRLPRVSGKKTAKDPATVGRVLTIKKKSFHHSLIMSVSLIFYQLPQHPWWILEQEARKPLERGFVLTKDCLDVFWKRTWQIKEWRGDLQVVKEESKNPSDSCN